MELKKINIMEGSELKEYDVLFTVKDEQNNKEYILYTDMNSDIDIYAAIYNEKERKIDYIKDKDEQEKIKKIFKDVIEKIK